MRLRGVTRRALSAGLAIAANPKDPAVGEAAWRTIRDFAELPVALEDWRRQAP